MLFFLSAGSLALAQSAAGPDCDPAVADLIGGICVYRSDQGGLAGETTLVGLALKVVQYLLTLVGIIAIGAIVIGGYWYITSGGNDEQAEKGKKTLLQAIIGLIVVLLAYTIVTIIVNTITAPDILA